MAMKWKRNINVQRVVVKVVATVLALYVGGFIMTEIGNVMNSSCSPFYKGLSLIGWTVGNPGTTTGDGYGCLTSNANTITATSGSGVLSVIGIVAIASIVTEFVEFSM